MENKKIIIISASERLRDFFKLEALNFDFSVECLEKLNKSHADLSNYDLAIIDIDTVKQMPLNGAEKQLTVSAKNKNADITYPCLISELRNIFNSLYSPSRIFEKADDDRTKIVFYKEKNTVSVNKRKYTLSDAEYKILTLLCKNPEEIVLRENIQELFEKGNSNISDVYICKLRKKLEASLGQRLIFTVREKGYKIVANIEWR